MNKNAFVNLLTKGLRLLFASVDYTADLAQIFDIAKSQGIVLASGAGALGVRLGLPIPQGGLPLDRPELGIGDEADADFMQSTVGLVWRALVFWMVLLLLLGLASLAGT